MGKSFKKIMTLACTSGKLRGEEALQKLPIADGMADNEDWSGKKTTTKTKEWCAFRQMQFKDWQ